ncbi:MAG TPA: hypothetical protein VHY91_14560 [Pirellulales bacterium]|jgi:hypothetical protein|nr:hypothetical protein [Pirellulales bacterium]
MPKQSPYTGNADATGYDPSFILTGPTAKGLRVGSGPTTNYLYYTPDGTGKPPLSTWQGVIDEVNFRIFGDYISSLDTLPLSQDFIPGFTVPPFGQVAPTAPLANAKPVPPAPPARPLPAGFKPPQADRPLEVADFLVLRDVLRIINPHIVFQRMSGVLSSAVITDLLLLRWVQRIDHFVGPGIDYIATTTTQATAFNSGNTSMPPTALYEFDMQTGAGPQIYTWLSPTIPEPDDLLKQWSIEDTLTGSQPAIRGKVTTTMLDGGFLPIGDGSNTMPVQGDWIDTFTFRSGLGALSGGMLGANVKAAHNGTDTGTGESQED